MSKETIGGKTRDQWEMYLILVKGLAEMVLVSMHTAKDLGDKIAAEAINEIYDALLNLIVLSEFVVDNHDWKEKKKNVQ